MCLICLTRTQGVHYYISYIGMRGFLSHFGLKKVIDFYRFDLKLGMFNALRPGVIWQGQCTKLFFT